MAYDLRIIRSHGITLKRNGNKLEVFAPKGTMNSCRKEILQRDRELILQQLKEEEEPDHSVAIPTLPELSTDPLPSYLEALTCRIQALEAEYAAAYGEPAPGEKETCRELSWKDFYPAEQRRRYNERYETLLTIERLKRERSTALAEGRTRWTPGPSDELLLQKSDGSFVSGELDELDEVVPDPPAEVTAIMGPWNQRLYGKRAVKCTRTAPGVVKCELVGDVPKHEKGIPNGKIPRKTAKEMEYQKGA